MTKRKKTDHEKQAHAFITSLHDADWFSLCSWSDGGHVFEVLQKRGTAGKRVMVQIYPEGEGFEVWRPVTESNSIDDARIAVEYYGNTGR